MTRTFGRILFGLALAPVFVGLSGAHPRASERPALSDLLDKAAAYLEQYAAKLSAVISQETYSQTERTLEGDPAQERTRSRALKSQVLLLNGGRGTWLWFRDVFQVDGKPLPDHVGRFETLLATSPAESAGAGSLANQIALESVRYNLGGVTRNFNIPTMALTFLRRENQSRSSFRQEGPQPVDGRGAVVVSFAETRRPTLVRGAADSDVRTTGRVWIESSGRIDKAELSLTADHSVTAVVTVIYGVQPSIAVFVPVSMHEHYQQSILDSIEAFATYSDFVVPTVSVDVEGFKLAAGRTGGGGGIGSDLSAPDPLRNTNSTQSTPLCGAATKKRMDWGDDLPPSSARSTAAPRRRRLSARRNRSA